MHVEYVLEQEPKNDSLLDRGIQLELDVVVSGRFDCLKCDGKVSFSFNWIVAQSAAGIKCFNCNATYFVRLDIEE